MTSCDGSYDSKQSLNILCRTLCKGTLKIVGCHSDDVSFMYLQQIPQNSGITCQNQLKFLEAKGRTAFLIEVK